MSILYDPRYQTFENWACLLCEQYAAQNLSIPNAQTDWKQWAEASGEFIGSQRRFSDLLLTRGLEKWRNTAGVRGFQGIGLKEQPAPGYTPYADN